MNRVLISRRVHECSVNIPKVPPRLLPPLLPRSRRGWVGSFTKLADQFAQRSGDSATGREVLPEGRIRDQPGQRLTAPPLQPQRQQSSRTAMADQDRGLADRAAGYLLSLARNTAA